MQEQLDAPDFLGSRRARVAAVQSLQRLPDGALLVPAKLAPPQQWLDQALFAIKHEGVHLGYLAEAVRRIDDASVIQAFVLTPNGTYLRKLCFLWEAMNGRTIAGLPDPSIKAAYVSMFDEGEYLVGASRRHPRWRVDFNGLGHLAFCPMVRRTPALQAALKRGVLREASDFASSIGPQMLDRALSWAYLSETEGSYAIEGETPSLDKTKLFARLLQRAHDQRELNEEYLVELQNAITTNPFDKAVQFRTEQNRLQSHALGAAGVTYVPPEPDLSAELMQHLMHLANRRPPNVDALVHAAVVSFGFVLIHPFMDGNGRLSRFLVHHCLGQSGALPAGFLLPISVAMKKHEQRYLDALIAFSKPARALCDVTWAGDEHYSYQWRANADIWFRTMDLTEGVQCMVDMAQTALDLHLKQEVEFLGLFDDVARHINARHDLRGSDLATLIVSIYQNGGRLSKNRRKRFAERVLPVVLDDIESTVARRMKGVLLEEEEEEVGDD